MNKDNLIYKKVMQKAGKAGTFCPFRKEFQMEVIESHLKKDLKDKKGLNLFEACSGQGRLLYYLNEFSPEQNYFGIDYVEEHVEYANKLFSQNKNIKCQYGDVYHLPKNFSKKFDITFLYKTMYCIPDYEKALKELFRVTKNKIYITAPFYEGNIDFELKIKNRTLYEKGEYVTYYIEGIPGFLETCKKLGAKKVTMHDMNIPFRLSKSKDPNVLKTHTEKLANGKNLEVTGIMVSNWKLVVIELK